MCLKWWLLFQVSDDSMPVGFSVLPAGDMNPVILVIGCLQNHLVEVGVVLDEVNPLAGSLHVGVTTVVVPGDIRREGQQEVGSFA